MKCIKCNEEIPKARLKVLATTKTCVECSNAGKVAGFPIITGKTTYSELQIVNQEKAQELYMKQERKGKGISDGIKNNQPLE